MRRADIVASLLQSISTSRCDRPACQSVTLVEPIGDWNIGAYTNADGDVSAMRYAAARQ